MKLIYKYILLAIYKCSAKLNVWSWQKLYSNKKTGIGYTK